MRKASELVVFAEKAYQEKWGYVWGASGETYTREVAKKLYGVHNAYKYNENYFMKIQLERWGGRKVCDDSGLLRAFGASGTAHQIYNKCIQKAEISGFNLQSGVLVFCQNSYGTMSHVGIIVNDGYVIHSKSSEIGVIKEKFVISMQGWTHYGVANFIEYEKSKTEYYTVVKGDNMTQIAKKHNTTVEDIRKLNPDIDDINLIYAGQKVRIK